MTTLIQFIVIGISMGALYGLMALPLSLVWSATRTLDFAVGGYAVVAGMVSARLALPFGPIVALLIGTAGGAIVGAAYLYLQSKRARGEKNSMTPTLVSVGLLFALVAFAQWQFGTNAVFVDAFPGVLEVAGIRIPWSSVVNIVSVALIAGVLAVFLKFTRLGKWMRACAGSAHDAPLVGIPVRSIQFGTFMLTGFMSALAGLLLLSSRGTFFGAGFALGILGIGAMLVFGMRGLGTALLGGMVLGLVESLGTAFLPVNVAPIIVPVFLLVILAIGKFDHEAGTVRP